MTFFFKITDKKSRFPVLRKLYLIGLESSQRSVKVSCQKGGG